MNQAKYKQPGLYGKTCGLYISFSFPLALMTNLCIALYFAIYSKCIYIYITCVCNYDAVFQRILHIFLRVDENERRHGHLKYELQLAHILVSNKVYWHPATITAFLVYIHVHSIYIYKNVCVYIYIYKTVRFQVETIWFLDVSYLSFIFCRVALACMATLHQQKFFHDTYFILTLI